MDYYYAPPDQVQREEILLRGDDARHVTRVMRHRPGDAIRIVDGAGTAFDAEITSVEPTGVRCRITARHPLLHEPPVHVTLAVALLKNGAAFDFLVEKSTELGISALVPLLTDRTIARRTKTTRWHVIALASMKQCGRCVLPSVSSPRALTGFLEDTSAAGERIILHEQGSCPAPAVSPTARSAVLLVGPEGGFSDREVAAAEQAGFRRAGLGPRRLRAETAAIVSVALVIGA